MPDVLGMLSAEDAERLAALTPAMYIGLADELVDFMDER